MGQASLDNISVSSQFLFQAFRSCQELGARKPVLLSALDIMDAQLRDPQAKFSSAALAALCEATGRELGRENIFSEIGSGMMPTGFSDNGYAAMFEETIGDVLQSFAMAIDRCVNRPMLRWQRSETNCRLIWNPDYAADYDMISIIFSLLSEVGATLTEGGLSPIKAAHFRHREPRNYDSFVARKRNPLQIPRLFNQSATCLEIHPHVIDLPNPFGNRMVARFNQDQLNCLDVDRDDAISLTSISYSYLFGLLDKSGLSLDAAAETFGMAERTLRRKLVAEGASFRQILEQVRKDACRLYFLEGTRSLSEIATKLGYSELSAFTRAYTSWHGRSPSRDLAAHIALAA